MENVYESGRSNGDAADGQLARERKEICERLAGCWDEELLWQAIVLFQNYPFCTSGRGARPGVAFTYTIKERRDGRLGGEMVVDRKEKTITQSSVYIAYRKVRELGGIVTGPKKLGVFGASYLYPVFIRFGVIRGTKPQGEDRADMPGAEQARALETEAHKTKA